MDNGTPVVYKTIRILGPVPGDRKLVVRRGASDDHVRSAMLRMYRVSPDQPVSILINDAPTLLSYEHIVDGGLYKVKVEHNVHRRRRTMIQQGAEVSGFRYSVGVDWREVSNMLRKAIEYGEEQWVINELHGLLALHVIERLESFADDPTKETYSIGKTLDQLDRDLNQLSTICSATRLSVLERFQFLNKDPRTLEPKKTARQLIENLDNHMRERSKTGWWNLLTLLQRSYLQRHNLVYNVMSCLLSAGAGITQPVVTGMQVRLIREVAEARTPDDLQQVGQVFFWSVFYSAVQTILQQLSKYMHTKQTQDTVQVLRNTSASLMSRADQAFLDTHDVEDILTTLETDIGNIELLLRYGRGWLIDMSRVVGSARIIACSIVEGSGTGVVVGAVVGVAAAQILRRLKNLVSHTLDHVPEEEDEVQEYAAGMSVKYTGSEEVTLAGIQLERKDVGTVLSYSEGKVTCRFAAGEHTCDEDNLVVLESTGLTAVQEVDYDEVWEEENFRLARQWGRDVEEVSAALAVKEIQMKKQNEFVLVPNIIMDIIESLYEGMPKFLMIFAAMLSVQKFTTAKQFLLGERLLLLESEVQSAITVFFRIQAEMRSLVYDCFVGARRTLHLLNYRPTIDVADKCGISPNPASVKGELEFRGVSFAYPTIPHKKVLTNLNLKVAAGSHVAIVGRSGCGKSSLFSLLSRMYDPDAGEVLLDGINLKEYDVKHLRRKLVNIAVQDPHLFDGSLGANVKYANPDATSFDVQRAIRIASADKMVERLPEKLLTTIGGGVRLSGGEQKRIGLARTLLSRSRLLLLDEPTAGLDASTESCVKRNLNEYRKDTKTTIITISHNLSFIQDCDRILVMGDPDDELECGRIISCGTHEELMRSCMCYARLATESQIRSPTDSDDDSNSPLGSVVVPSEDPQEIQ
eukprot:TRINITY_DN6405_c0_g3_i2.p1 TRINITY_DN6405_c0_g3~~TRINITY_DN6405_c0_g3_i2.p1  ORF type:complete len:1067 (+),score=385.51 TRINITY_DN6405_c0_g3_i2:446-3202(+)